MPKVTIEIEDSDEDGQISFYVNFDPPLDVKDPDMEVSPAQGEGAFIIDIMQRRASGQTLAQIAEEMDDDEYGRVAGGYVPGGVNVKHEPYCKHNDTSDPVFMCTPCWEGQSEDLD